MFPVYQVWPKPSCKAQSKGEEDKADKERGGKTTSGNGQALSSRSPRGQLRTGKNRENWLQNHLWCPNDHRGQGIDDGDDDDHGVGCLMHTRGLRLPHTTPHEIGMKCVPALTLPKCRKTCTRTCAKRTNLSLPR